MTSMISVDYRFKDSEQSSTNMALLNSVSPEELRRCWFRPDCQARLKMISEEQMFHGKALVIESSLDLDIKCIDLRRKVTPGLRTETSTCAFPCLSD